MSDIWQKEFASDDYNYRSENILLPVVLVPQANTAQKQGMQWSSVDAF